MKETLRRIADNMLFQNFIIGVILFAGVLVGIETYPGMVEEWGWLLHKLDAVVLGIFIVEILIKMGAEGRKPWRFFYDPWNVFDFVIVAVCLVPGLGQYAMVLRLARLLRVFRLVRAIPRLQLLVSALLRSLPSMGYVSILLFMLFYMFAVAGVFMFSQNDPVHFGNLQTSLLSLFRVVTLEDWTDIMYTQMYGCDVFPYGMQEELCTDPKAYPLGGALFFVTFVLLGTMIVLNLFIGIIVNSFDAAKEEMENGGGDGEGTEEPGLADQLEALEAELVAIQTRVAQVRSLASQGEKAA
jgi:voltage-gated sodium channel